MNQVSTTDLVSMIATDTLLQVRRKKIRTDFLLHHPKEFLKIQSSIEEKLCFKFFDVSKSAFSFSKIFKTNTLLVCLLMK